MYMYVYVCYHAPDGCSRYVCVAKTAHNIKSGTHTHVHTYTDVVSKRRRNRPQCVICGV